MSAYVIFGPDGAVTESCTDHGDGTGTRTLYDTDGNVTATEQVSVEIPEPAPPSLDERVAELVATVATLLSIIEGT